MKNWSYRFIIKTLVPAITLFVAVALHGFLLSEHFTTLEELLLLFGVVIIAVLFQQLLLRFAEKHMKVVLKTIHLNTETKINKHSRKGLIVFLSLYNLTRDGKSAWKEMHGYSPDENREKFSEDVRELNKNKDYKGMLIDEPSYTNFGITTRAISTHSKKLKMLWIISTESERNPNSGSVNFIETYKHFLKSEVWKTKEPSINSDYTINIDEDSKVAEETSDLLSDIYKEAGKSKVIAKKVLVDVTPGTVSMTTGAILGSISRERDIQLLTASYEPGHGLKLMQNPVIIKYQTLMPHETE